jgi:hypothetical protein
MSASSITNKEVWQIGRPGSKSVDVGQRARHRWLGIGGHDLLLAADSAAEPVFKATREPGYGAFAVLVQLVGIGVLGA